MNPDFDEIKKIMAIIERGGPTGPTYTKLTPINVVDLATLHDTVPKLANLVTNYYFQVNIKFFQASREMVGISLKNSISRFFFFFSNFLKTFFYIHILCGFRWSISFLK